MKTALKGVESSVLFPAVLGSRCHLRAPTEHICYEFWPKKVPKSREKPQQGATTWTKLVLKAVVELRKATCLCFDPVCLL